MVVINLRAVDRDSPKSGTVVRGGSSVLMMATVGIGVVVVVGVAVVDGVVVVVISVVDTVVVETVVDGVGLVVISGVATVDSDVCAVCGRSVSVSVVNIGRVVFASSM